MTQRKINKRINVYMQSEKLICPRLFDYNNLSCSRGPIIFDEFMNNVIIKGKPEILDKDSVGCLTNILQF
jgi:hypothetical protein